MHVNDDSRAAAKCSREAHAARCATTGVTQRAFYSQVAFLLLLGASAFWLTCLSEFGPWFSVWIKQAIQLSYEHAPPLIILFLYFLRVCWWVCLATPPLVVAYLAICFAEGMFSKGFWRQVEQSRLMWEKAFLASP
ncbi:MULTISPECIES: hypothetical protein [Ralstonia]|uniref:Transmembrane protein n=2 Tax=Ralstonia TaxID=48736 RepID=A0AAD2BUM4_9RALS|nr:MULTISPECIES: hypothetical protein [Ralstonia]NMV39941.1 hypothetical protein [Ralstonia insidiosa]CAJ0807640.1 hypothetical protein R77560_04604 [Ralstonia sp. LMG 18095]